MKKVLINSLGVYVAQLDVVPETIIDGYNIIDVEDDTLFLHDKKRYVDGVWEDWDPRTLEDYKTQRWEYLKTKRDETLDGGFTWNNLTFDSDPKSRGNIQGAVTLAQLSEQGNQPFSITWTLKDNTTTVLNIQEMKEVGVALANHLNTQYNKGRDLRAQLDQATTKEEIESIVWDQIVIPPGIASQPIAYIPGG